MLRGSRYAWLTAVMFGAAANGAPDLILPPESSNPPSLTLVLTLTTSLDATVNVQTRTRKTHSTHLSLAEATTSSRHRSLR